MNMVKCFESWKKKKVNAGFIENGRERKSN